MKTTTKQTVPTKFATQIRPQTMRKCTHCGEWVDQKEFVCLEENHEICIACDTMILPHENY